MQTRRQFLGQASCAAVSSIPILSTLLNLQVAERAAAVTAPTGSEYRALVCLFLSGGNDSFNMLVPQETAAYNDYKASRSNLALLPADLTVIHPIGMPDFAVHKGMPEIAALFEQQKAAFVANVGSLVEPVQTRTEIKNKLKRLPLGLYSHSDQIEQWQTSVPHARSGIGWSGRMSDLIRGVNPNQVVPMQISLDGGNVWQTGNETAEYAITPTGAVSLSGYAKNYVSGNALQNAMSAAVDSQLAEQYTNLLAQTFNQRKKQALDAYQTFATATAAPLPGNVTFPTTYVGQRLAMIARAIHGRAGVGALRQTFFVNWGGWDHHGEVLTAQAGMLPQVSAAIGAFQAAMAAIGMENNVTLFTASDFGRTLTSNNRGSDHAWGGNQLVVGGAVRGQRIFGQYPSLKVNADSDSAPEINPRDTGRGRFIPSTSCDEFFAEMALWLGVSKSDLPLVLPNIGNFFSTTGAGAPVGFLA